MADLLGFDVLFIDEIAIDTPFYLLIVDILFCEGKWLHSNRDGLFWIIGFVFIEVDFHFHGDALHIIGQHEWIILPENGEDVTELGWDCTPVNNGQLLMVQRWVPILMIKLKKFWLMGKCG